MQAMLRRVTVRIEVTTAQGEHRTITAGVRVGEPIRSPLLLEFVRNAMAGAELELVDASEQPVSVAAPVVSTLTAPAVVASPSLPSSVEPASPSAAPPATGDFAPALKRSKAAPAAIAAPPSAAKHVVRDAHRRIEPTRNERADVVIGPRDVSPVTPGAQRVMGATVVIGRGLPSPAASVVAPLATPDFSAPAIKRKG